MLALIVLSFWSGVGVYDFLIKETRPVNLFDYIKMGPIFWIVRIIRFIKDVEKIV